MTKTSIPTEMSKRQSDSTQTPTNKFDYTAISDRPTTVSWSNFSKLTGVVNRFTGPTFTPHDSRLIKRTFNISKTSFCLKLDITLTIKKTYKWTKDKNLVSNKYTVFCSSHFSYSDCGSSLVKTYYKQANIVGRKIVAQSRLEHVTSGLQSKHAPYRAT